MLIEPGAEDFARAYDAGRAQVIWTRLVADLETPVSAMLKLSTGTEDGREQIVGVAYPSDFIGRPFGKTTSHSVTALTDAEVCVFARADFDRFAGDHPALEQKLLRRTLSELDRTRAWMLLLARKSAEEKVATFLLDMSERLVDPACENPTDGPLDTFDLPFSRLYLAGTPAREVKASRPFIELREEVLRLIFADEVAAS